MRNRNILSTNRIYWNGFSRKELIWGFNGAIDYNVIVFYNNNNVPFVTKYAYCVDIYDKILAVYIADESNKDAFLNELQSNLGNLYESYFYCVKDYSLWNRVYSILFNYNKFDIKLLYKNDYKDAFIYDKWITKHSESVIMKM